MRFSPLAISLIFAAATTVSARADEFILHSENLGTNASIAPDQVYNRGECHGGNVSPQLNWSGAPEGTRSFAVTMVDLDAGGARAFVHWALFDIDAKTTELASGAGSSGPLGSVSAVNGFGDSGYGGPCPPKDEKMHRYVFAVYALRDEHLGLAPGSDAGLVQQVLASKAVATATLQAEYGR